jgi:phosphoribosylamine--glycine ligase
VEREIIYPTIAAMAAEGRPFKGVLYFGLMLTDDGPKVLEYNARFGDPEAQVVLPLLRSDLVGIMEAIIDQRLDEVKVEWYDKEAACVVLASGGYPARYTTGYPIMGLDDIDDPDVMVFHAGTKKKAILIIRLAVECSALQPWPMTLMRFIFKTSHYVFLYVSVIK